MKTVAEEGDKLFPKGTEQGIKAEVNMDVPKEGEHHQALLGRLALLYQHSMENLFTLKSHKITMEFLNGQTERMKSITGLPGEVGNPEDILLAPTLLDRDTAEAPSEVTLNACHQTDLPQAVGEDSMKCHQDFQIDRGTGRIQQTFRGKLQNKS